MGPLRPKPHLTPSPTLTSPTPPQTLKEQKGGGSGKGSRGTNEVGVGFGEGAQGEQWARVPILCRVLWL